MRVLLICHAYGTAVFQHKVQLLDAYPDVEMGLVVPRHWGETLHQGQYQVLPGATFRVFPVRTHHGNNVWSFFYNPVELLAAILAFRPHILHVEQEPWSVSLFQAALLKALMPWRKLVFFTWENIYKEYPRPYRWFETVQFRASGLRSCWQCRSCRRAAAQRLRAVNHRVAADGRGHRALWSQCD